MKTKIYIFTILLFTLPIFTFSQMRGKVFSSDNNVPIEGATIRIKDNYIVTVSDTSGEFLFPTHPAVSGLQTLIISCTGFQTKSFKVNVGEEKSYYLNRNIHELQTITLSTGYQDISKERSTGSFVSIDNTLLNRRVSSDILSRIEDVTSGLSFDRRRDGEPSITIRGQSTIMSNATALIIVDNFPYEGDINNINPDDIEQVTVLKDAAAASIWGARASNGVIVMTTKKGRLNSPLQISFNSHITLESKPDVFYNRNFLNSTDFISVEEELFEKGYYDWMETDYAHPVMSPVVELLMQHRNNEVSDSQLDQQLELFRRIDVRSDFDKHLFRQGVNQQNALSFKGGSDRMDYFVSSGFNRHNLSAVKKNDQRFTLNGSFNFHLSEKLVAGTGFAYAKNIASHSNFGYGAFSTGLYPYAQLKNADGAPAIVAKDFNNLLKDNAEATGLLDWYFRPLDELEDMKFTSHKNDIRLNNFIRYNILGGLSLEARYQYQNQSVATNNLYKEESYYVRNLINQYAQKDVNDIYEFPIPIGAILNYGTSSIATHSGRFQGEYIRSWNKNSVNAIAGFEMRQMKNIGNTSQVYGYDEELINFQHVDYTKEFTTMPTWSSLRIPSGILFTDLLDRNISYYSNIAYTYNSRYTFSGSMRKDQSNLFGVNSNQKGVPLWSLGGSWNLSQEKWYPFNTWLQFVKVRTTYGYNGNVNKSLTAYATARYTRNTTTGFQQAQILTPANADLRWEKIGLWNIGLDFRAADGLLSGSFEYYRKKGVDLIGNSPLDPTVGFIVANRSRFTGNNSDMKAEGIDVQLNFNKSITPSLRWNATLLYNYNKDRVTKFEYETDIPSILMDYPTPVVDYPRFSIFSFNWAGLDDDGNPQVYLLDDQISKEYSSLVNYPDKDILKYNGPALPTQFGAFRNTLTYHNLSIGFNIAYKFGHYFRRSSLSYGGLFNSHLGHVDFEKRWQKPGDELVTDVPSMPTDLSTTTSRDNIYINSSHLVEKADNIRVQDINIGYNLQFKKSTYFRNMSVYGYVNNVGLLWRANKAGIDPDVSLQSYPYPTTYSIGITLK